MMIEAGGEKHCHMGSKSGSTTNSCDQPPGLSRVVQEVLNHGSHRFCATLRRTTLWTHDDKMGCVTPIDSGHNDVGSLTEAVP